LGHTAWKPLRKCPIPETGANQHIKSTNHKKITYPFSTAFWQLFVAKRYPYALNNQAYFVANKKLYPLNSCQTPLPFAF
jgi:hypothetical protein